MIGVHCLIPARHMCTDTEVNKNYDSTFTLIFNFRKIFNFIMDSVKKFVRHFIIKER